MLPNINPDVLKLHVMLSHLKFIQQNRADFFFFFKMRTAWIRFMF